MCLERVGISLEWILYYDNDIGEKKFHVILNLKVICNKKIDMSNIHFLKKNEILSRNLYLNNNLQAKLKVVHLDGFDSGPLENLKKTTSKGQFPSEIIEIPFSLTSSRCFWKQFETEWLDLWQKLQ